MRVVLNGLILIILALLALPFLAALALLLLFLDFLYLFRRSPESGDGGAPQRKVLIIQSADPGFVLKALERPSNAALFRDARLTLFCRDRSEILKPFAGHPMLHRIETHSETQGWRGHFDRLRREHLDAAAVFFTGDPSYWKIKCFALLLGAQRKYIFDEYGNYSFSSWTTLLALFERDLILQGLFNSTRWKMNPRLQRLAECYRSIRAWLESSGSRRLTRWTLSAAGFSTGGPREGRAAKTTGPDNRSEATQSDLIAAKQLLTQLSKIELQSLLSSNGRLQMPSNPEPEVSAILVLFNRAELTLQCLRSLVGNGFKSMEVIIVDNNSSDETSSLLDRIEGATIVRSPANIHFLKAANLGAGKARGRNLLFLNNDAQVLPGSIEAAVRTMEKSAAVGAVGGKLILPDGRLQAAGDMVWKDGSCLGYGRGDDPFAPPYMFRREVDYCSGAFLLTRRETFLGLGGFDEAYQPFYYEETDFCLKLWEQGLRVIYEPEAVILHYEFASSSSSAAAQEWHARHQGLLLQRHRERLQSHYSPDQENVLAARVTRSDSRRVLFIDDRVPHPALGSGFPRSNAILSILVRSGYFVTFYPTAGIYEEWRDVYADIPREIEVMLGCGPAGLDRFLAERAGYYDVIIVSRPHNMQYLKPILQAHPDRSQNTRVFYDAEAIFASREIAGQRLKGETISENGIEQLIKSEISLASEADLIIAVSPSEAEIFARHGARNIHVLGHAIDAAPTARSFGERSGFLFVGSILEESSPNGDAVLWFLREILPIIQNSLGDVPFTIAGANRIDIPTKFSRSSLRILGKVDDLTAVYDQARGFVAPTRFSAGIPHKIHEAAARGVPVVATSLLMRQLGWSDEDHLLIGDTPHEFASQCIRLYNDAAIWQRLRANALDRVLAECSPESFEAELKSILRQGAKTSTNFGARRLEK